MCDGSTVARSTHRDSYVGGSHAVICHWTMEVCTQSLWLCYHDSVLFNLEEVVFV